MNFYTVSPVRFSSQGQASRTPSPPPGLQKFAGPKDSVHFGHISLPQPPVNLPSPIDNLNAVQQQHVYRLRQSHDPNALSNQIEIFGNGRRGTVYSISDDPLPHRRHAVQTYYLYLNGTHVGEIYREHNGPWSAYKLFEGAAPIPLIPQH